MKNTTRIGGLLLIAGLIILAAIAYDSSRKREIPVVFSPESMLASTWEHYKDAFIEAGTFRTLDKQQQNITTSEGQSYTMLRAVWEDDKQTFDGAWKWTQDNLQRPDDRLFSWLFGDRGGGSYGILEERGGANTASDADVDIAFALLQAGNRWHDTSYTDAAKAILADIWDIEVVSAQGKLYLAANNLEKNSQTGYVINPSYFSPAYFRAFAKADPNRPWMQLVDSSYEVLTASSKASLNSNGSAGLPPNWMIVDRNTGAIRSGDRPQLDSDFSYDAMRIPWRIALDYQWHNEARAKAYLDSLTFLSQEWTQHRKLNSRYSHAGEPLEEHEAPAIYGGTLGYFTVSNEPLAKQVYEEKLQSLYNPDTGGWKNELTYYDENWAWFGIGLYHRLLPDLTK